MQRFLLPLSLALSSLGLGRGVLASSPTSKDGLKIDVTRPVECERKTQKDDRIHVHYRGTLHATGAPFDASYDRGAPLAFKLGAGMVIRGWDEGLLDMCQGEKRTLTVQPSYGYGSRAMGPIPANSVLVFETELMAIDGVPKPASIETKSAETSTATDEPAASAAPSGEAESAEEKESYADEGVAAKLAAKVTDVAHDAAGVDKTVIADTDDTQAHNEL